MNGNLNINCINTFIRHENHCILSHDIDALPGSPTAIGELPDAGKASPAGIVLRED